jgi:Phospholipase/Carboxylesterase
MQLDGPGFAPLFGRKPAYLVVLLHGVAANGNDLISLARAWRKILPKAEFIAPNAPFPCDNAPEARKWFSLQDRAPEKLLAGLREAGAILDRFFDELLAGRQLDDARLALAGFSQGAATALYAGLRRQTQNCRHRCFLRSPAGRRGVAKRLPEQTAGSPRSWRGGRCRAFPVDGKSEGHARSGGRARDGGGEARPWPCDRRRGDRPGRGISSRCTESPAGRHRYRRGSLNPGAALSSLAAIQPHRTAL